MSNIPKYIVNAHYNESVIVSDEVSLIFENTDISRFSINRRTSFQHFKERVEMKVQAGSLTHITYRNAVHFRNNQFKFVPLKVFDDEDVETLFSNHECSEFSYIDLYVAFEQCQQTQISQVINASIKETPTTIPHKDVEEEDVGEENEAHVGDLYTTLFEEGNDVNKVNNDEQHIPIGNDFCPPAHMTNLPLNVEGTSFE
ncbi:unnamed protein product [Lathyrus sativus]|nr:unnamed protein product [Lathyrus sativus]